MLDPIQFQEAVPVAPTLKPTIEYCVPAVTVAGAVKATGTYAGEPPGGGGGGTSWLARTVPPGVPPDASRICTVRFGFGPVPPCARSRSTRVSRPVSPAVKV